MIKFAKLYNSDGFLITAGFGESIRSWDIGTGKLVLQFQQNKESEMKHINCIAISNSEEFLVTGSDGNELKIW